MVNLTACEDEYRKACEKYRSAALAKTDAAVIRRRWRVFLIVEAVLLACLVSVFIFGDKSGLAPFGAGALGPLVVFSLPVAVLYLLGNPPVMSLDLDCSSAETRAMTRDVRNRATLNDGEFYARFYAESPIQRETIDRVRGCLRKRIDPTADRLLPSDYLPLLWDGLDFADLLDMLAREFSAVSDFRGSFNGTLDSLIRLFHGVLENGTVLDSGSTANKNGGRFGDIHDSLRESG
jgi:hypothetical protein